MPCGHSYERKYSAGLAGSFWANSLWLPIAICFHQGVCQSRVSRSPVSHAQWDRMSDPVLVGHWKKVMGQWDDEAVHGAFIEYCRQTEQLGEAAALYAGQRPEERRRASAEKKLEAVALLATSSLLASKSKVRLILPRRLIWLAAALLMT